ncbi:MAG: N-6 DNA methylase [Bacteroidia bacterium]|nr:N-6 DNA methylase [Bacteroidia bacterium]
MSTFVACNKILVKENFFIQSLLIETVSRDDSEAKALQQFLTLWKEFVFDLEVLIEIFEFVVSPAEKEINGAVYTPGYIREYIVDQCIESCKSEPDEVLICDPACGCSGFLLTAAQRIKAKTNRSYKEIIEKQLYGLDIAPYSIERSKILLSLLAISEGEDFLQINFNLVRSNALSHVWRSSHPQVLQNGGFDIVVGNPPYVCSRKMDGESKSLLKNWSVSKVGNPDLYIPFFQIGTEMLASDGILGYITMNSFLKSLNGRSFRAHLIAKNYSVEIIDFGNNQVFKGRNTYTCLFFLSKYLSNTIKYTKINPIELSSIEKISFHSFNYNSLPVKDGWNLSDVQTTFRINKIEKAQGVSLGNMAEIEIKNGIATLKNNLFIFSPIEEDDSNYYVKKFNQIWKIEKSICRNIVKPNIMRSQEDLFNKLEKVLFPYQSKESVVSLIPENDLQEKYPLAYKYLSYCRLELSTRDKGNGSYQSWYAFGRTQALNIHGYKLFTPHISDVPRFFFSNDQDLLFYNGYALVSKNAHLLKIIQKVLNTTVFWEYIKSTSKPYDSNYFWLSKSTMKNFVIPDSIIHEINGSIFSFSQEQVEDALSLAYGLKL